MKQIKNIIIDNLLSNNQEIVSTTSDRNGYPKNEKPAITGFADWAEAVQAQEEHGGYLMTLQRRYGQQLWSRTGTAVEELREEDGNRVMSMDYDSREYAIGLVDYNDPDKEPEYRVEDSRSGEIYYKGESAAEAVKKALSIMDEEPETVAVYKDGECVFVDELDDIDKLYAIMSPAQTVGENIMALRVGAGLSQMQLAKKTGLRQATIADIETGKSDCRISTLQTIAVALDCDIADLFE